MRLNITDAVKEKINKKLGDDQRIVFDLDDGVGQFSESASCTMNTHFRILLVDKDIPLKDYSETIDSDYGEIAIKPTSVLYFDDNNTLDLNPTLNTILYKNNSGIIDTNVPVMEAANVAHS